MGMFQNSTKETKEFEKIILEIEKERDTISWAHTTIQSCLWNLENPKADRFTIDPTFVVELGKVGVDALLHTNAQRSSTAACGRHHADFECGMSQRSSQKPRRH